MHGGYAKTTWISPGAARVSVKMLVIAGEPASPVQSAIGATAITGRKMPEAYRKIFGRDGWIN